MLNCHFSRMKNYKKLGIIKNTNNIIIAKQNKEVSDFIYKKLKKVSNVYYFNKDYNFKKIDKKKLKELSKRRDTSGLIHFFFYFLFLFIFGYLAYISWGTWWSALCFFIYGTIYAFSVANWHETVHRTAFKTRWIN